METYPVMDLRFPESKEGELRDAMKLRATSPWRWQAHDAFERACEGGSFYFHRDRLDPDPPCTICVRRQGVGHLVVGPIVPDANTVHRIPRERYVQILQEFDREIAGPAVEGLGGMTLIGTATHTLEDYFSCESIRLLDRFCNTSNAGDLGSHVIDQEKWIAFLLQVHSEHSNVDCDTFGKCLRAKKWWPDAAIADLVHEFDFAQRLLRQRDQ